MTRPSKTKTSETKASRPRRLGRMLRRLAPILLVLVAVGGVAAVLAWPGAPAEAPETQPKVVNVHTERVTVRAELDDWFELDGTVEPDAVRQISAEVAGRIEAYGQAAGALVLALDDLLNFLG